MGKTPKYVLLGVCVLAPLVYLSIALYWGQLDIFPYLRNKPIMLGTTGCYNPNVTHTERRKAAVLGAFVADAASMPLHWIYNVDEIEYKIQSTGTPPAFFNPPSCPFYEYEAGQLSPYGDEALPLLRSLVDVGTFDGQHFTQASAEASAAYTGRLNSVIKAFMKNVQAGQSYPNASVEDDQAHGLVKVPILVARFAGQPDFDQQVLAAVATHQRSDVANNLTLAAAKMLEYVVLGHGGVREALAWGAASTRTSRREAAQTNIGPEALKVLEKVLRAPEVSHVAAVGRFGQGCLLPASFQAAAHNLMTAANYTDAVQVNILAGGDSCSRAHLIGAFYAAEAGLGAIPPEWKQKTTPMAEIEGLVDQLVQQAAPPSAFTTK